MCECPDWWHRVLTSPPQTVTREDLERFFKLSEPYLGEPLMRQEYPDVEA